MISVAAWVLAGIALWFSRSVLDVFNDAGRVTRVAALPSAPELAGLIVLSLLVAAAVGFRVRRWTTSEDARAEAFFQISLPLFGLALTALPYLPWLPDVLTPLRALAGPFLRLIWIVVIGQVLVAFFQTRSAVRRLSGASMRRTQGSRITLAIAIATAALATAGFLEARDTLSGVAMYGHAVDWPVRILSLRAGIVIALATALAVGVWRWVFGLVGSAAAATFAWLAVFLSAPVIFTAAAPAGDIPAACCVVVALCWRSNPSRGEPSWVEYLVRGLAVSALPWLSISFVPLAVVLAILIGMRVVPHPRAVLALLVPITVSLVRRFLMPHGPVEFGSPLVGAAGLVFDQEFGLLPYAPAMLVALAGLWRMLTTGDVFVRRRAAEITIVAIVMLGTAGAAAEWWGPHVPPARPLVPVLPLLALPLAWAYRQAPDGSVRRSIYQILAIGGLALTLLMAFSEHTALIEQDKDGSARLLQWFTMLWPAWRMAPSVIADGLRGSLGTIAVWLLAAGAIGWLGRSKASRQPGVSALLAFTNVCGILLIVAIIAPATRASAPSVDDPEARSRQPMLDNFDAAARPHAVIFHPFTLTRPQDIPPLMTLSASPGLRRGPQPVRVLLDARYALAAGDYAVEIGDAGNDAPLRGTVGLQVGRIGNPYREWSVELPPHGTWRGEFTLPVDAEFLGFVTSDELSAAKKLRVTPLRIVDENVREAFFHGSSRIVLSAIETAGASIFFHDEDVYPERNGFWVRGESTALVSVAPHHPGDGVTLRMHCGAAPNTVRIETTTWGDRVSFTPGKTQEIHVPPPARPGPFLLRIAPQTGFTPADSIAGNTDRRFLGCWIEPVQ